jgi:hypothetical protein
MFILRRSFYINQHQLTSWEKLLKDKFKIINVLVELTRGYQVCLSDIIKLNIIYNNIECNLKNNISSSFSLKSNKIFKYFSGIHKKYVKILLKFVIQ